MDLGNTAESKASVPLDLPWLSDVEFFVGAYPRLSQPPYFGYFSVAVINCHTQKQCTEGRLSLGLWFQRNEVTTVGRLSNRKVW